MLLLSGTGKVYGWGSTGASLTDVLPPTSFPNILQEAELRVCTASEIMSIEAAAGAQFGDGQLCTVGETGVTPALVSNKHRF